MPSIRFLLPALATLALSLPASADEPVAATAPPAETPAQAEPSTFDQGVEAFARGQFQEARAFFDVVLKAPASADEGARAKALRDLADRYMRTGAHLVFPAGNAVAGKAPSNLPDERTDDEIVQYYLLSVPYGLGLGAYASMLAKADSPAGIVFPVLAGIGLAAGAMAYADHGNTRPYGEPQAIVSGALVGMQLALPLLHYADSSSAKENIGYLLGAVTLGGAAGLGANHAWGTTPGEMSFVGSSALWANVLGALGAAAGRASGDTYAAVSLASVAAGTAVGAIYARELSPSIAHVRYLDFGALAGGIALGGLYFGLTGSSGNAEVGAIVAGVGVIGGGIATAIFTKGMRRDEPRRATAFQWSPTITPTAGGATFGIGGTF